MTLLDAPSYDPIPDRRLQKALYGIAIVVLILPVILFNFWNWAAEHRVNRFFDAVQTKNLPQAFSIWNNDSKWQEHADHYASSGYSYQQFVADWGPTGEYGDIANHKIRYSTSTVGNSLLIAVQLNGRKASLVTLGVGKKDSRLGFTPFDLTPGETVLGWTRWQISYH